MLVPDHRLPGLKIGVHPVDPDRKFMGHTDLGTVIYDGRLVQGKLKTCGGFQFLRIVPALVQETVHVVVVEEGREKIILGVRSEALTEDLLQLLVRSGPPAVGDVGAHLVPESEIQNAIELAVIFPLDAFLGHTEHPSEVFVPDLQGLEMPPGDAFQPGLSDQNGRGVILFYFHSEGFPEGMCWADRMIQPETVESEGQPVLCRINDMFSCLRVVQIQFRKFLHVEEAQIIIRPFVEEEPVNIPALPVFLGFLKERVSMGAVIRDEVRDDPHAGSVRA